MFIEKFLLSFEYIVSLFIIANILKRIKETPTIIGRKRCPFTAISFCQ